MEMPSRGYRKRARAAAEAETRHRIARAALELHEAVGPARTTISDIARRAGVSRVTVYSHYPDEAALLGACTGMWAQEHPPPDLGALASLPDPRAAAEATVAALYRWYEQNEAMLGNSIRDAALLPALAQLHEQTSAPYQRATRDALLHGFRLRGRRREEAGALIGLALEFGTWHALVRGGGLASDRAARLMGAAIVATSGQAPTGNRRSEARHTRSALG